MTLRPIMLAALASLATLVSACAIDVSGDDMSDVEAVRANAALAIQQCGEGNVASVRTDGYECGAASSVRD